MRPEFGVVTDHVLSDPDAEPCCENTEQGSKSYLGQKLDAHDLVSFFLPWYEFQ